MSSTPIRPSLHEPRPFLIHKGPALIAKRSLLGWWHLLSLDAPTVAVVWTVFLAWCAGARLSWADPCAMFLAVWSLYAADRLLDARALDRHPRYPGLEERHHFHHAHRGRFVSLIVFSSLLLPFLLDRVLEAELHLYTLLACLLGAWLVLVHARSAETAASAHALPKELAVGVFFPAAVLIPTLARASAMRSALLPAVLSFASVCTLNCLFLDVWENALSQRHGHISTQWGARHLRGVAAAVLLLTLVLAVLTPRLPAWPLPHPAAVPVCCAFSAALLMILHKTRHRFRSTTQRALADLVLLTPLLFLFGAGLFHLHA